MKVKRCVPKASPELSNYLKLDKNVSSCVWNHSENCFVRIVDAICEDLEPNKQQRYSTLHTLRKLIEDEMKATTKIYVTIVGTPNIENMKQIFRVNMGLSDYRISGYFLLFQMRQSSTSIFGMIADFLYNNSQLTNAQALLERAMIGEEFKVFTIYMDDKKNLAFNIQKEFEDILLKSSKEVIEDRSSRENELLQLFSLLSCDQALNSSTSLPDLL